MPEKGRTRRPTSCDLRATLLARRESRAYASSFLVSPRGMTWVGDLDANDLRRIVGPVRARIGWHPRDFLYQVKVLALSENRVFAIEMRCGNFGDEELRSIGIRPAVRHCQPTGLIEGEIGTELVFETVAGIA